jgi:hypothetical protein
MRLLAAQLGNSGYCIVHLSYFSGYYNDQSEASYIQSWPAYGFSVLYSGLSMAAWTSDGLLSVASLLPKLPRDLPLATLGCQSLLCTPHDFFGILDCNVDYALPSHWLLWPSMATVPTVLPMTIYLVS